METGTIVMPSLPLKILDSKILNLGDGTKAMLLTNHPAPHQIIGFLADI